MGEYSTDVYNITNLTLNIRKRPVLKHFILNYVCDVCLCVCPCTFCRREHLTPEQIQEQEVHTRIYVCNVLWCKNVIMLHI